ncbi:MAG: hypothetical protein EBZ48_05715 [Proteobacteria bacterium]|nr:hypothetical protein [Pseudomonadota bacterium]
MRYQVVLFDADETLFDYKRCAREAFREMCSTSDMPEKVALAFDEYEAINTELWRQFDLGKITREDLVVERFRRFFAEKKWR